MDARKALATLILLASSCALAETYPCISSGWPQPNPSVSQSSAQMSVYTGCLAWDASDGKSLTTHRPGMYIIFN